MASAAKLLGIERTELYRLCRMLGIALEGIALQPQPKEES